VVFGAACNIADFCLQDWLRVYGYLPGDRSLLAGYDGLYCTFPPLSIAWHRARTKDYLSNQFSSRHLMPSGMTTHLLAKSLFALILIL
jgi:hypothetical protein